MPDRSPPTERRYARLLWAYPRWHRKLHGPDMTTAMLDADAARGHGLTRREAGGVIADGLRLRLRVRGVPGVALALLLAVVGAATAGATASRDVWRWTAAPYVSEQRAAALAATVAGPAAATGIERRDAAYGSWLEADSVLTALLGSPELRPGGVHLTYPPLSYQDHDPVGKAAAVLVADGWTTAIHRGPGSLGEVVADRDGLRLWFVAAGHEAGTYEPVIAVYPTPPSNAYAVGIAAAAIGALLGWLVAAAGLARARRRPPGLVAVAAVAATAGALASLPASLLNLVALGIADRDGSGAPPWVGYEFVLARPLAAVGALLLVCGWLVSLVPVHARIGSLSRVG